MATTTVSGTVKNDAGEAVAGATVTAKDTKTEEVVSSTTSNSSGRFTLTETVGGDYVITATKNGVWLNTDLDTSDGVTTKSGLEY